MAPTVEAAFGATGLLFGLLGLFSKPKSHDECEEAPVDPTADPAAVRLMSCPPTAPPAETAAAILRQAAEPVDGEMPAEEATELAGPPAKGGLAGLADLIKMLELVFGGVSLGLYFSKKDEIAYSDLAKYLTIGADSFAIFIGLVSVLAKFGILGGKPAGPPEPVDEAEGPLDPSAPVAL